MALINPTSSLPEATGVTVNSPDVNPATPIALLTEASTTLTAYALSDTSLAILDGQTLHFQGQGVTLSNGEVVSLGYTGLVVESTATAAGGTVSDATLTSSYSLPTGPGPVIFNSSTMTGGGLGGVPPYTETGTSTTSLMSTLETTSSGSMAVGATTSGSSQIGGGVVPVTPVATGATSSGAVGGGSGGSASGRGSSGSSSSAAASESAAEQSSQAGGNGAASRSVSVVTVLLGVVAGVMAFGL